MLYEMCYNILWVMVVNVSSQSDAFLVIWSHFRQGNSSLKITRKYKHFCSRLIFYNSLTGIHFKTPYSKFWKSWNFITFLKEDSGKMFHSIYLWIIFKSKIFLFLHLCTLWKFSFWTLEKMNKCYSSSSLRYKLKHKLWIAITVWVL
jgi:hypothetical protein